MSLTDSRVLHPEVTAVIQVINKRLRGTWNPLILVPNVGSSLLIIAVLVSHARRSKEAMMIFLAVSALCYEAAKIGT